MLGKKIGEETGKVTGSRILRSEDGKFVKMEVSFQSQGKLLGVDGIDVGTYLVHERVPGQLYGEGQGIFMTKEGGVIWNGFGVGSMTGAGMAIKWAASVTYQTNVAKLASLNGIVGVIEHATDDQGNATSQTWEWKSP